MIPFLNDPLGFDTITDGMWDLDVKNDRISLGPNAMKLLGHKLKQFCTRQEVLDNIVHKEYRNVLHEEVEKLLKNQSNIVDTEIKLETKTKDCIWINLKAIPVSMDQNGKPDRLLGSIRDITKCKIAEKDIAKEREVLRTIIDNLPVTIYILDKHGRKVLSNKADCEIIGAPDESEVLGKTDLELYQGPAGERGHQDNMEVLKSKTAIINREEVFDDKNGSQRWLLTSMIPLLDRDNQITGLVGIGVDITEQKRLQNKISESENFYRTLINISPNGVVVTDLAGVVTFVSERTYQIFKIPENENLIGECVFDWLAPESFTPAKVNFREVVEARRPPQTFEYKALDYYKSDFWAEFSSSLLFDFTGKPSGLMIICRDITYRKKIEADLVSAKTKAEENDMLKTAFLHNISHEIRTPLNAIMGFSALLGEPNLCKGDQQSYIEIIEKSSNHLLAIISDIIEISNIEAGIISVSESELDLNELLRDLYKRFLLDAERKNIKLIYSFNFPASTAIISSDKTKLIQILSNLLSNALKFTDIGRIEFGCRLIEEGLEFYVSDTGKGIPEDKFDKIFDRFYQVEHTETRRFEGTGLGLSISKAYVEVLGGKIWLDSKVAEGTTFYFTLPDIHFASINFKNSGLPSEVSTFFEENKTILIAEDDENNYRLLCEMLKLSGLNYLRAKNGIEAVEIVKSVPGIDLILMDIKMPLMNGFEAAERIKLLFPELPIIASTAYASDSDKETALKIGFSEFLSKPFTRKTLYDSISRIIQQK